MINGIDFHNLENQKYWSFASNYKGDPKEESKQMVFSGDYVGSIKHDGAFYKFIKNDDGSMELLGRSKGVGGDYLNKINWVKHLNVFFEQLPNGTCLLGELYFPDNEGSNQVTKIMGCLETKALTRQEKDGCLFYYIFDVLAFDGQLIYEKDIESRIAVLDRMKKRYQNNYVAYAKYCEGNELWDELQKTLAVGGEGIVITKKGTSYQPGKRPARQTLKIKKELQETIDCFFTGNYTPPTKEYTGKNLIEWPFWQNIRTNELINEKKYRQYMSGEPLIPVTKPFFYGWAGSLEIGVMCNGDVRSIGYLSGLTDEVKSNPTAYQEKCIEITCMQILYGEDGEFSGLRHAKMLNWRPDLSIEDCTFDKIFQ